MGFKLSKSEEKLKPFLTEDFLATLKEAVKVCGWSVDLIESSSFVMWCFDVAGKKYKEREFDAYPFGED